MSFGIKKGKVLVNLADLAAVAGLDDQTKIRRQSTSVGCAGSLLIGVGRREVVGELWCEPKGRKKVAVLSGEEAKAICVTVTLLQRSEPCRDA